MLSDKGQGDLVIPLIWKGLVKPPNKVLKNKIGYLSQVILHELPEKIRT